MEYAFSDKYRLTLNVVPTPDQRYTWEIVTTDDRGNHVLKSTEMPGMSFASAVEAQNAGRGRIASRAKSPP